jgi:hypothetical protein
MLRHLRPQRRWDRQVGLFLVACCRQVQHQIPAPDLPQILAAAERYSEGLIKPATMARRLSRFPEFKYPMGGSVWTALWCLLNRRYDYHPGRIVHALTFEERRGKRRGKAEAIAKTAEGWLCDLLRDVVGNPFRPRPAHDPAWLAVNGGIVRRLATNAYEDRTFSEFPILADALEDAGCADAALLEHLHGPGPHVRGCWALDVVLGKH